MDLGLRLNYRPVFTKAHMLKLAGIVTAVLARPGDIVAPGRTLVEISAKENET